jgi:hypothetical protein
MPTARIASATGPVELSDEEARLFMKRPCLTQGS